MASTKNPVYSNPFAVLVLSADATGIEIRGAINAATMRVKLSGETGNCPGIRRLEDAAERLRDPIKRFEHGLFWPALSVDELAQWRADPKLRNLTTAACTDAVDRYLAFAKPEQVDVRAHNLAVLYLGQAIACDIAAIDAGTVAPTIQSADFWKKSLQHWAMVLHSDAFWERMRRRCDELADPRLNSRYLSECRRNMPVRAMKACEELATDRLLDGDPDGALSYIHLLRECPFEDDDRDACLQEIYKPLTDRIEHRVLELQEMLTAVNQMATLGNSGHIAADYTTVLESFRERVQPLLDVVMKVGDLPGYAEEHARDRAAELLRSLSISCHNNQRSPEIAQAALEMASKYVSAESMRAKLAEDHCALQIAGIVDEALGFAERKLYSRALEVLDSGLSNATGSGKDQLRTLRLQVSNAYATHLFNQAMEAAESRDITRTRSLLDQALTYVTNPEDRIVIQRMVEQLRHVRAQASSGSGQGWGCLIAIGIAIGLLILIGVISDSSSSSSRSRTGGSTPTAPSRAVAPPPTRSSPQEHSTRSRSTTGLSSQIDAAKERVRTLESQVADMDNELESMDSSLRRLRGEISGYELDVRMGRRVNESRYQQTIDAHNDSVEKYNTLVERRNRVFAEYEREVDAVNGLVRRYNRGQR